MKRYCCSSKPHEARVYTILSDNGREFCGRPDHHPTSCFPCNGGEHRTTKVPPTRRATVLSSDCSRTLLDEHFRIKENDQV